MVVAKATKPKSAGISNRARIIVLIRPIAWMASCAPTVQLLPIAISWARLEDFVRWSKFVGGLQKRSSIYGTSRNARDFGGD